MANYIVEKDGVSSSSAQGTTALDNVGVYQVTAQSGAQSTSCMVVRYDPSGGFVTGGGWIESPVGAFKNNTSLHGHANFGFSARYKKGATVPDGETTFVFQAANFKFKSTEYDWLVVKGQDKAMYKGCGVIEGLTETYNFILSLKDKGEPSRTCYTATTTAEADTFRIKITGPTGGTEAAGSAIVYDNLVNGAASTSYTGTCISGGSIKIHTNGKVRALRGDTSE